LKKIKDDEDYIYKLFIFLLIWWEIIIYLLSIFWELIPNIYILLILIVILIIVFLTEIINNIDVNKILAKNKENKWTTEWFLNEKENNMLYVLKCMVV